MKKPSKELSGPSLNRFFRRFFRAQPGLDARAADQLASVAARSIASIRLRRVAWAKLRQRRSKPPAPRAPATPPVPPPDAIAVEPPPPSTAQSKPEARFDPYAFGFIPVYQREGRDGLLDKLSGISGADNLRKMARAQQIALPAELRKGEIPLDELRAAIANAVEKRMADRRAAAG